MPILHSLDCCWLASPCAQQIDCGVTLRNGEIGLRTTTSPAKATHFTDRPQIPAWCVPCCLDLRSLHFCALHGWTFVLQSLLVVFARLGDRVHLTHLTLLFKKLVCDSCALPFGALTLCLAPWSYACGCRNYYDFDTHLANRDHGILNRRR